MSEQEAIEHWVEGAKRMLDAAKHSFKSKDYEVVLFTCHLAVEKIIKANYIAKLGKEPLMTHNLVDLCSAIGLELSDHEFDQLNELTSFSAFARYGDESWIATEATSQNCRMWIEISSNLLKRFQL